MQDVLLYIQLIYITYNIVAYIFGESLLPTIIAVILGVDVWIHFLEHRCTRLLINLSAILIVGAICAPTSLVYPKYNFFPPNVGMGYTILVFVSLMYIISYIRCKNRPNKFIYTTIAVGLIIGGILIVFSNMRLPLNESILDTIPLVILMVVYSGMFLYITLFGVFTIVDIK